MPYYDRRSPRLTRFDYTTPGAYFVTIVTHQRRCLLAGIVAGRVVPTAAGRMVDDTWTTIPARHAGVDVDTIVVMPNHVHGILTLAKITGEAAVALPDIVGAFKSLTTHRYIDGVRRSGWRPFERRLWQRSYYERVIRDDAELSAYREYIATNPVRWMLDREFPERTK